ADGTLALAVGERGANWITEIDEEGFVCLDDRVPLDRHRDVQGGFARIEGQRSRTGDVVAAGNRCAVAGSEINGHGQNVGLGEGHGEDRVAGAYVAFVDGDVRDRQAGGHGSVFERFHDRAVAEAP